MSKLFALSLPCLKNPHDHIQTMRLKFTHTHAHTSQCFYWKENKSCFNYSICFSSIKPNFCQNIKNLLFRLCYSQLNVVLCLNIKTSLLVSQGGCFSIFKCVNHNKHEIFAKPYFSPLLASKIIGLLESLAKFESSSIHFC